MKLHMVIASLLVSQSVHAQDVFTAEQRAEIERIVRSDREQVRDEVERAICAELAREGATPQTCKDRRSAITGAAPEDKKTLVSPSVRDGDAQSGPLPSGPPGSKFFGPTESAMIDSSVDGGRNRFAISAASESNRASVRLNRNRSWGEKNGEAEDKFFSNFSATFSAPIDKQSSYTNLATLDGFANSSEVALRYTKMYATGARNPFGAGGSVSPQLAAWFKETGVPEDIANDDGDAVRAYLREAGLAHKIPELEAFLWAPEAKRWLYGASLKLGSEKFEYTVPASTTKDSVQEQPWAIGLFAGLLPTSWNDLYLGFGLEYQQTFKAATSRTVCPAVTTNEVLECTTNPYGPPSERDKLLLSIEARRMFKKFPAVLKLTHDLRNDETGLDLPIFLLNDTAGGYSSGVRIGWTDTDQFSFGVFFGSDFDNESTK